MHAKKIGMITWVLKYHRSRWHVEEGNGEVIARDSGNTTWNSKEEIRELGGFQDYVDAIIFLLFLFFIRRSRCSTGFFLIAESAESLIQTDNKKDDEPSWEGRWGLPTCHAARSIHTQDPLAEHFWVTSAQRVLSRVRPPLHTGAPHPFFPLRPANLAGVEFFPLLFCTARYLVT